MIDQLFIENFKAFGERQSLPLGPITLIFGGNSAGKTSLIQALLVMRQSIARLDRPPLPRDAELVVRGELVDLGSFDALVHRHDRKRDVTIGWTTSVGRQLPGLRADVEVDPRAAVVASLTFRRPPRASEIRHASSLIGSGSDAVDFVPIDDVAAAESGALGGGHRQLHTRDRDTMVASVAGTAQLVKTAFELTRPRRVAEASADFGVAADDGTDINTLTRELNSNQARAIVNTMSGLPAHLAALLTTNGLIPMNEPRPGSRSRDAQDGTELQRAAFLIEGWLSAASRAARSAVGSVTYLGPMRKAPERIHVLSGEVVRGAGSQGEFVVDLLARRRALLREVNEWFARLDIPYSLDVRAVSDRKVAGAIGEVHCLLLKNKRTGVEVAPTDVGFGIGQVLPVIVQAVLNRRGTLCIEQPEIHLHPALQAELAELFAEKIGPGGPQFILETHSEHLILRLQRLIRLGRLKADQLVVLHVGEGADGQSHVRHLRVNDQGEFVDEWPGGFFDERIEELLSEG